MVKFGWETYSQTFSTTVFMDISQPLAASASSSWSSATGVGRLVMDPSLAHLTPQFNVWPDKSPISQLATRVSPSSTFRHKYIQEKIWTNCPKLHGQYRMVLCGLLFVPMYSMRLDFWGMSTCPRSSSSSQKQNLWKQSLILNLRLNILGNMCKRPEILVGLDVRPNVLEFQDV